MKIFINSVFVAVMFGAIDHAVRLGGLEILIQSIIVLICIFALLALNIAKVLHWLQWGRFENKKKALRGYQPIDGFIGLPRPPKGGTGESR